ncbi:glucuronoxylan 4-O-methyltransferase 1-like [Micractinium conductrix]|uniref:Glucuronoxylan 4-O-methyltransferase 1-like n=1 Tax=Micractinium conductrix TaxID=554055 RepID=A0A2P6VDC2_9CHLO|nr:glucuronoxylan 4-O-methyltransferase 1-like [Micractinium conductrix]|eukprot:PSC72079.1 glucuronoxylan 4-O-methyltransferase 1-like [Micractinium conductrix]
MARVVANPWRTRAAVVLVLAAAALALHSLRDGSTPTEARLEAAAGNGPCRPYRKVVEKAIVQPNPPQLRKDQLLRIAGSVHAASEARGGDSGARLLVFGVGFDSGVWAAVNCKGRTVFLEHNAIWLGKATKKRDLEAYLVSYRGDVGKPEEFFAKPWLMEVPAAIEDACWDVILVDAPTGYKAGLPGRMESTFYAVSTARRCIEANEVEEVTIYLHDAQRPVEKQIIAELLTADDIKPLGELPGKHGLLSGFKNVESCQVPPSPQFNAEQAVRVQLDALAANNQPWPQHGIQTAYEWAVDVGGLDPSLYFGFPKDLYHFDHFLGMFANKLPELVNLQSYDILGNAQELPATDDSPPTWVVRARVVGGAGVAQPSAEFEFQLRRKTVGARKGALMTHMIRRVAQQ